MARPIKFVEVESGLCGQSPYGKMGAELGIDAIKLVAITKGSTLFIDNESLVSVSIQEHYDYQKNNTEQYFYDMYPRNLVTARHIDYLLPVCQKVATDIANELRAGSFPFVLAGDHSTAAGTIAGIRQALPDKKLGVVWIDAHGDLHSPYTSQSGNMHGMPVGVSLALEQHEREWYNNAVPEDVAEKWRRLCHLGNISPKIDFADLVFIGIRDLEEAEWDIIKQHNIKHFRGGIDRYADTHSSNFMNNFTMHQIYMATIEHLSHCDIIYVSFDIDSVDGGLVPGTGTPVPHGLNVAQARDLLSHFWHNPKVVALEMVEVNPLLDIKNQTAVVAYELIGHLYYSENNG
ncbi:MAG: arginase [Chitinophagales bacterium]|nr:arginase [Chitinophagales bacterium]